MNDADFKREHDRIEALADRWLSPLGLLSSWTTTVEYFREPLMVHGELSDETVAQAKVQWEYRTATLQFCLPKTATKTDNELEYIFVHECCHVPLKQMREWCQTERLDRDALDRAMKHEEYVVTSLAWAFIKTRAAGVADTPQPCPSSPIESGSLKPTTA